LTTVPLPLLPTVKDCDAPPGVLAIVVTVSVDVAIPPFPTVTEVGLNVPEAPSGSPLVLKVTVIPPLPPPVTEIGKVTDPAVPYVTDPTWVPTLIVAVVESVNIVSAVTPDV